MLIFLVRLTTSRIGNLTRLIHILLFICDDHIILAVRCRHSLQQANGEQGWSFKIPRKYVQSLGFRVALPHVPILALCTNTVGSMVLIKPSEMEQTNKQFVERI